MALAMATRSDGVKSFRISFSCVFPGDDAGHVHDPGQDRLLLEDVPDGSDAALPEDEFQLVRNADGLEQSFLANALGQGREVAHVLAMAAAHLDVSRS